MDEDQIKALITESISSLKDEILTSVDQKNSGAVASMKREVTKALEPITGQLESLSQQGKGNDDPAPAGDDDKSGKLTLKALQQQLEQTRQELQAEKQQRESQAQQALQSEKKALLSGAIAKNGLINGGVLQDVLMTRWGDRLTKEGDQWLLQDGDNVKVFDEAFGGFVNSEEGKTFLPPSGTQGGGGNEGRGATTGDTATDATSALVSAFGSFG